MDSNFDDSVDYRLLTPGELLLSVDGRYTSGSDDFGIFVAWLALECWIQGSLKIQSGDMPVSRVDTLVAVAVEAQKRFDTAVEYLHEVHGVTINRFEMLSVMRDAGDADTSAAIGKYIVDHVYPELMRTIFGDESVSRETGSILDDGTASDLVNTMMAIGTFYRDRSRYDSDEKRELHDHAMDILTKLYNAVLGT